MKRFSKGTVLSRPSVWSETRKSGFVDLIKNICNQLIIRSLERIKELFVFNVGDGGTLQFNGGTYGDMTTRID